MRAVVQRVQSASVSVQGKEVSAIGPGLLVLLGVGAGDGARDLEWMVRKVTQLRIFQDEAGKMNRSVKEVGGALLVVSQFTLYGDVRQGNRPSFIEAQEPGAANATYEAFCQGCEAAGLRVSRGVFRAEMKVSLVNDGPVTLWLESPSPVRLSTRPADRR
jgi:D-aminoacyl-tRNA deacylase